MKNGGSVGEKDKLMLKKLKKCREISTTKTEADITYRIELMRPQRGSRL